MQSTEPPEPDGHEDVQLAVDRLAARLDLSVLVEDRRQRPVWLATRGPVDGTRVRTILNRRVDTAVSQAVRTFDLAHAVAPVRTPGIPALDMWARWCMPVHSGEELLGLLWVLDPDDRVRPGDFPAIVECAERAAELLARAEVSRRDVSRRREALVRLLLRGRDVEAARELARRERLPADARVQVDAAPRRGGWTLPDGLRAHVAGAHPHPATSGAPLPLLDLAEAVRRAQVTQAVVRAGAELDPVSWDALGAWRLVVEASDDLPVAAVHPAAETLAGLRRTDLLSTARTVLDLGGDVAAAAENACTCTARRSTTASTGSPSSPASTCATVGAVPTCSWRSGWWPTGEPGTTVLAWRHDLDRTRPRRHHHPRGGRGRQRGQPHHPRRRRGRRRDPPGSGTPAARGLPAGAQDDVARGTADR